MGHYETHLTVATGVDLERLRRWAEQRQIKYTRIVLDRGDQPDQPMLTWRGGGTLDGELATVREMRRNLQAEGFTVVRVKIEAAPFNDEVPATSIEAAMVPAGYFEHHVKLVMAADAALTPIRELSRRHAAQLSRNARRVRADGRRERFVTQRCHGVGRDEARRALDELLTALATENLDIAEVEEEFVLLDDNLAWDAGWFDESAQRG
ncbi:hypothetical protein GCM10023176_33590 [Micromonospora coerulea]|uniref:Ankyrin n=1 Tax=Micromonospora coerulea TaxID=47856 RepID=A0ABP8SNH8_9ACTN